MSLDHQAEHGGKIGSIFRATMDFFMGAIYAAVGGYVFLHPTVLVQFSMNEGVAYVFAALFGLYGLFRMFRGYQSYSRATRMKKRFQRPE
jgi:hypothetical protein